MKPRLPFVLAAALCAAVMPAYAAYDAATNTYSGTGNTNINLATTPDNSRVLIFDMVTGGANYFANASNTYAGDIQIGAGNEGGGLRITDGYATTTTFEGTVTGSGILSKTGPGTNNVIRFTGDVTAFTGEIQLGATEGRPFTLGFGSGQAAPASATAEHGVSGTGTITFSTNANTLEYNYGAGSSPVYVTNAITKTAGTSKVTLSGAAAMEFTKSVAIDTLTIGNSAASATFHEGSIGTVSGTAAGFTKTGSGSLAIGDLGGNTLTINEGSVTGTLTNGTVAAGTGGTLGTESVGFTLDGGTIDFGNVSTTASLSATGTLTLTSGNLTIGNLDTLATGTEYTLINGSSLTWGSTDFSGLLVNGLGVGIDGYFYQTIDGQKYKLHLGTQNSTNSLVLSKEVVTAQTLTWSGGDGTWSVGGGSWAEGGTFSNDDDVVFSGGTGSTTITLDGALTPFSIIVAQGEYVFAGGGSIDGGSLLTVGDENGAAKLTIETANASWRGTVELKANGTLVLGHADALGASIVTMRAGSVLELTTGTWDLTTQLAGSSAGTIRLTGAASASTNSTFTGLAYEVGQAGTLNLAAGDYTNTISGSGSISLTGNVAVSGAAGFTGTWTMNNCDLTVKGSQDVVINAAAGSVGRSLIKDNGTNKLTVNGGGYSRITASAGETVFSGTVTVSGDYEGGKMAVSTIVFEGGAKVSANNFYVHYEFASADSNANKSTATVQNGATLNVANMLQVARDGKGILTIEEGGTVIAGRIDMGTSRSNWTGTPAAGKQATINLDGGSLYIGANGITQDNNLVGSPGVLNMNKGLLGTTSATGWSSALGMTIGGTDGGTLTVNTQQYNATTGQYEQAGGTIVLKALSGTGCIDKTGLGTLELTEANTYTGTTTVTEGSLKVGGSGSIGSSSSSNAYNVANGANLVLSDSGSIANSGVAVSARTAGTEAALSNATVTTSGICRAADEGAASVENASVSVTQSGAFSLDNVNFVNSLVDLSKAGSVTLSNVVFDEGSKIALTLGNEAGVMTSTTENLTHTFASGAMTADASVGKTLNWTGVEAAKLVLDLNNSLLCSADLAGKNSVMIWLEGLTLTDPATQLSLADHLQTGLKQDGATVAVDSYTSGSGVSATSGTVVYIDFAPAAMPEPTTATLSLLGLSSLLLRRRRRA